MERGYKFKIGQRVKMRDEDDRNLVYGTVTDTSGNSVFIKWDDLREPTEHFESEYSKIQLSTK